MAKRALTIAVSMTVLLLPAVAPAQPADSQVTLNNDSIRATIFTFRPGAAMGRHQGLGPELGIVIEGELTLETPNGQQTLRPGNVYWIPSLTPHDVRNEGPNVGKLWDILFKRCE